MTNDERTVIQLLSGIHPGNLLEGDLRQKHGLFDKNDSAVLRNIAKDIGSAMPLAARVLNLLAVHADYMEEEPPQLQNASEDEASRLDRVQSLCQVIADWINENGEVSGPLSIGKLADAIEEATRN